MDTPKHKKFRDTMDMNFPKSINGNANWEWDFDGRTARISGNINGKKHTFALSEFEDGGRGARIKNTTSVAISKATEFFQEIIKDEMPEVYGGVPVKEESTQISVQDDIKEDEPPVAVAEVEVDTVPDDSAQDEEAPAKVTKPRSRKRR